MAQFPRIIIPKHLIDAVDDLYEEKFLRMPIFIEQDDFYTINYIYFFCQHSSTPEEIERVTNFLNKKLDDSLNKSVREKYLYVKYWMDTSLKQDDKGEE